MESKVAENLVGVLKSIVREEIRTQSKAAEETSQDRAGTAWTEVEETRLFSEFDAVVAVIAVLHQRTPGAIRSRLSAICRRGDLFRTDR